MTVDSGQGFGFGGTSLGAVGVVLNGFLKETCCHGSPSLRSEKNVLICALVEQCDSLLTFRLLVVQFYEGYGQTECTAGCCLTVPGDWTAGTSRGTLLMGILLFRWEFSEFGLSLVP